MPDRVPLHRPRPPPASPAPLPRVPEAPHPQLRTAAPASRRSLARDRHTLSMNVTLTAFCRCPTREWPPDTSAGGTEAGRAFPAAFGLPFPPPASDVCSGQYNVTTAPAKPCVWDSRRGRLSQTAANSFVPLGKGDSLKGSSTVSWRIVRAGSHPGGHFLRK